MLILTRKKDQSIVIEAGGETITIKIVNSSNNVKVGIEAPQTVRINRSEILQNVRAA